MIRRRDLLARLSLLGVLGSGRSGSGAQRSPIEAPSPTPSLIGSIDGPLVVTGDLARQRALFEGVFGLSLVADQEFDALAVKSLFGVPDRTARSVLLETKGTSVGVRLVEFRPEGGIPVRRDARSIDAHGLEVITFAVRDLDSARGAVVSRGYNLSGPPSRYSTPGDGRFTEVLIAGPDGVNCGLVQMHDAPLSRYVEVNDQTFSEILGVTTPASDPDVAVAFYRDMLKLKASGGLPGSKSQTLLGSIHFGVGEHAPMIGVTRDALLSAGSRSPRNRPVLPSRGLQCLRFSVPSVDAVTQAATAKNLQLVAPPAEALLFPQGRVKSVLIRAPHGVLHHFTEALKA